MYQTCASKACGTLNRSVDYTHLVQDSPNICHENRVPAPQVQLLRVCRNLDCAYVTKLAHTPLKFCVHSTLPIILITIVPYFPLAVLDLVNVH